jgi:hypothetical protein
VTRHEFSVDTYPYRHAGETLGVEIEGCQIDGDEIDVDADADRISLFDEVDEDNWDVVTLDIAVTVESETLRYVFPDPDDHDGVVVVAGYCHSTHGRWADLIASMGFDAGTLREEIELKKESLRGTVQLTPTLLRNDHRSADDEYARESGRWLADGRRLDVYLDRPRLNLSGDLPVVAAKFSEPGNPGEPGLEWYVDVRDAEEPKLWLNRDYPLVVNAINEIERPTKQGIVGRIALNHLAVSMLTQFTIKAAAHAVTRNEIQYEWQRTLLLDICSEYFTEGTVTEFKESLQVEAISTTFNAIEKIFQRRRAPHEDIERLLGMIST